MDVRLQCRTLQCRIESVLKKLIRSQARVIIIGSRMTLYRWLVGWIVSCWMLDFWIAGQAATPDVAFVQLTSERGSTNKRTGGGTQHCAPRVGNIQMRANLNPVCQQISQAGEKE